MGLFHLFGKRKNSLGEPLDKLTKNGELPFGWAMYRKTVVNKIESELSVFRKAIHDAHSSAQKLEAIKSYFQYIEDGKQRYRKIGECEGKYFDEYIVNSEEAKENIRKKKLIEKDLALDKEILKTIKKNPGILQKNIYSLFEPKLKGCIQNKISVAEKEGIITREKSGSTYKLFAK